MREEIQKELLTVSLISVEKAYQLALRVEQQLRNTHTRQTIQNWGNLKSPSPATPPDLDVFKIIQLIQSKPCSEIIKLQC